MVENNDALVAYTTAVNDYDLDQLQYDALWEVLTDNPLLAPCNMASKNKALKPEKQNIIGAINELLGLIETQDGTVKSFETMLNQALGDLSGTDLESWKTLQTIDTNVVKAVVRIWYELGGSLDISDIGESIKEAISNLNTKLNSHEERIQNLEEAVGNSPDLELYVREIPTQVEDEQNVFLLSKTPNEKHVLLTVNGLEYDEEDDFTVDRETKRLVWINKEFDLDIEEDELDVVYYV
jgi:hypothetical protein